MIRGKVGVAIVDTFRVRDGGGNPVTTLADGDFTKTLELDGVSNATTVTVTRDGGTNKHRSSFTPTVAGHYHLDLTCAYAEFESDYDVLENDTDDVAAAVSATILASGTLQNSGVLAAGSSSDDQAYRGALLIPTGGTGAGQSGKVISTYNGTTKAFSTYQNFGTALDSTTTYVILAVADYARYVGDVLGSVTTLSAGAITASSISAGAITASKIATDAIGAAQLAADAVAEIQSGLATAAAVAAIPTTSAPTANQNADALLDRASAIDGATPRDTLARIAASSHGKVSGMASGSPTFLGQDGATPRIVATVDGDGNRTAVTLP